MALTTAEIDKVNELYKQVDVLVEENAELKSKLDNQVLLTDLATRLGSIEAKLDVALANKKGNNK